jgi:pyruvate/2-oxoglutarate dehydrogenase complex dihydrolipoamide dehydrogenase (E3) component
MCCFRVHNVCVQMRVLGLHYLGPNAGEVTQGYGGMFLFSPTKDHFDQLIGIHPTTAEVRPYDRSAHVRQFTRRCSPR